MALIAKVTWSERHTEELRNSNTISQCQGVWTVVEEEAAYHPEAKGELDLWVCSRKGNLKPEGQRGFKRKSHLGIMVLLDKCYSPKISVAFLPPSLMVPCRYSLWDLAFLLDLLVQRFKLLSSSGSTMP